MIKFCQTMVLFDRLPTLDGYVDTLGNFYNRS